MEERQVTTIAAVIVGTEITIETNKIFVDFRFSYLQFDLIPSRNKTDIFNIF